MQEVALWLGQGVECRLQREPGSRNATHGQAAGAPHPTHLLLGSRELPRGGVQPPLQHRGRRPARRAWRRHTVAAAAAARGQIGTAGSRRLALQLRHLLPQLSLCLLRRGQLLPHGIGL